MGNPFPHGTVNGYVNLGCFCDDCRAAVKTYRNDVARIHGFDDRAHYLRVWRRTHSYSRGGGRRTLK